MNISALIATRPRLDALLSTSLPSLRCQQRRPDRVVIVSDGLVLSGDEVGGCVAACDGVPVHVLTNARAPGAAGAWNTGLDYLDAQGLTDFVAILDDDDTWDPDHLALCEEHAKVGADVVISGLRMMRDGKLLPREPLLQVGEEDFLVGNPGWQGTNTFVRLDRLIQVGGFTDGLRSANDRDLAIRLLELPDLRVSFTGCMTATWHLGHRADAISARGSADKRAGLQAFYRRYAERMTPLQREQAKSRARALFDVEITFE